MKQRNYKNRISRLPWLLRFLSMTFIAGLKLFIYFYRFTISPILGRRCRFLPTCSEYALDALNRYGPYKGSLIALKRLSRCHPWGGDGFDPVKDEDK